MYSGTDWGEHLGEDCIVRKKTPVFSVGRGEVVYSAFHTSEDPPKAEGRKGSNWGGIVIIAHKTPGKEVFFSLYGHIDKIKVKEGDTVHYGQQIAEVAPAWTKENGWWKEAYLHFAIYNGPWRGNVLPGMYKKENSRTKKKWWKAPTEFIKNYK